MHFKSIHKHGLGFLVSQLLMIVLIIPQKMFAQTTAGNAVYSFLSLPYSAKATALGGMNISSMGRDLGLAMYNPSLLDKSMQNELHLSVKPFYAGIQQYDVSGMQYLQSKQIAIGWGIHYLNYGTITMTDIADNEIGDMHPNDYSIQVSAAANYIENFKIGTSLKYIHSNYGMYQSSGAALDIGLTYLAQTHFSQVSLLVKNIGMQFSSTQSKEELPFNIILGWSKKLENAPIQFSITADRLSVWNNMYYDSTFANALGAQLPSRFQNVFNHLTIASELYLGDQVDLDVGYSFNRRYDLNVQNQSNGLNGFSAGLGIRMERMHLQYGAALYQQNAYHHFTLIYRLKK